MKTKLLILSMLTLLVSVKASAYTAKINGIYYDLYSYNGNNAMVTYQSYVSTKNGGSVPSGYDYYTEQDILGYDEDDCPIYGSAYQTYYTSDYSGSITIPSTVTYNGKTYNVVGIRNHAFENCSATSVTISHPLPDIQTGAFTKYKGSLTINSPLLTYQNTEYDDDGDPYYVTYYPFNNCSFQSLIFGSNVTSIPESTFRNCTNLKTVSLSSSLTSIGSSAFSGCSGITTLTLPSTLTSIGSSAFSGCSNLSAIDINATSLTSIGSGVFSNCSKLKTVNLNSIANWLNVSLNNSASSPFYNGADLYVADEEKTTITFPVATTTIPAYAFYGCRNITSVTIPAQVSTIGAGAFANCQSLTAFNVNSNNSNFSAEDGILFNAPKTVLLSCLTTKTGAVTIPQTVTTIKAEAFNNCSGITSITLPSTLSTVGSYAFGGCTGINTINIKISDISSISSDRISYSFLPTSVTWNYYLNDNLVTELNIPNSISSIGKYAFYNAKGITSITLPNTITTLKSYAFSHCSGLSSLTLPNSLTTIGENAFEYCSGIHSFTLPNCSLTTIGGWLFYGCSGALTINCNLPNVSYSPLRGSSFSTIVIGDNVTSIGSRVFENQSLSASITLPNSVTIGGWNSITANAINIRINDISTISSNSTLYSTLSSTTWNYYINGDLVTELNIPSTVTSIGSYAFYKAKNFSSITLPSSLTSIGVGAFSGCTGSLFVNCNIPSASTASNAPFYNSSFNKVTIGDDVTSIGNYAFYNCSGIKSIFLPSSLTNIGTYAFYGCAPKAFICKATTPPAMGSNNAFGGQKKIYVPYASVDAYKSAWSQLSTSSGYQYLPLLDVMFFEQQTAESYAAELSGKDKTQITSVAFYDGGIDGTLTESVIKDEMNPNCLYYVPASAGLSGDNIITLDDFEAESVTLTDNYTYDCPIPFHTEEIRYVHNPSVWANGSAGWETICLPFEPESFIASERGYISPIMLGSTGNFWLRKFVGASSDAVYFSSTLDGRMEANTPYLIAFPGESMGSGHLQGQTITFQGYDVDIDVTQQPDVKNNNFIFVGNYDNIADGINGYVLNAAGNSFVQSSSVGNQPFRAYFRNEAGQTSYARLYIDPSNPTDVRSLAVPSDLNFSAFGNGGLMILSGGDRKVHVYSIDGRLERTLQLTEGENRVEGLHKGLYIIDNKKIMIR